MLRLVSFFASFSLLLVLPVRSNFLLDGQKVGAPIIHTCAQTRCLLHCILATCHCPPYYVKINGKVAVLYDYMQLTFSPEKAGFS